MSDEENKDANEKSYEHGERRRFGPPHEDGLGQKFAEYDIQHCAARKAQRDGQPYGTERAQEKAQHCAQNGRRARDRRDERRAPLFHAARNKRHGNGHPLGNVVKSDWDAVYRYA